MKKIVDKEGKLKFTDAKKKASEGMKIKDAGEDGSHEWQGMEVRVVSEMAGNFAFGLGDQEHKKGVATECDCLALEDAALQKPRQHRNFQRITRSSMQHILKSIAADPEPFVDSVLPIA